MAIRKIRFGVIGCGLMGREFASAAARWCHLMNLDFAPEIAAVCDEHGPAMQWFVDNVPTVISSSTDYNSILSDPTIDAIYCAVPHHLHAQIYVDILKAGKHLLGEKPFGIDLQANAKILAAIAERPHLIVRCSSEFPFYPAAQQIVHDIEQNRFGTILEVKAGFLHSSDLDPNKPINWKRRASTNGEYGCMGDLGMHVLHVPLRAGWAPRNVRAFLSNVITERPDPSGGMAVCDTWDNAVLACDVDANGQSFPMILETKRIAPGEMNTWYIRVSGTEHSAEFTTKYPKTLRTMDYQAGQAQRWAECDTGYASCYPAITGGVFEFGFADAILQMWAAFCDEIAHPDAVTHPFRCVTPHEAAVSHQVFTAALQSNKTSQVVAIE